MKLQLFQQIVELDHSFEQLLAGLAKLESVPFFQRDLIQHARSDVEIARAALERRGAAHRRAKHAHSSPVPQLADLACPLAAQHLDVVLPLFH